LRINLRFVKAGDWLNNESLAHNGACSRNFCCYPSVLSAYFVPEVKNMGGQQMERWRELAEAAAEEKDSERMLAIVQGLISVLDEREQQLRVQRQKSAKQP